MDDLIYFAYFIENTSDTNYDNSQLFRLIRDLEVDEEQVYCDIKESKEELSILVETIEGLNISGIKLLVRSVTDLSLTAPGLLEILKQLQDLDVSLCSLEETFLSGEKYYDSLNGFIEIHREYGERSRQEGYKKAKEDGRVGRPRMTEEIEKAIRLYQTRAFTVAEIEKLANISSSTLYRALKEKGVRVP